MLDNLKTNTNYIHKYLFSQLVVHQLLKVQWDGGQDGDPFKYQS